MKTIRATLILAALLAGAVHAQTSASPTATGAAAASTSAAMTDAEVRKVDRDNRKITLKHGAIKNLDMPAMTMVFQVKDPAMLGKFKAGDRVRFAASNEGGKLTVTELQPAK